MKPIDNMMQYLAQRGEIRAGFVLPFVTNIDPQVGVNSSIVEIPYDRYQLLALGRRVVSVDGSPIKWPERESLPDDLKPSLDYMRSLVDLPKANAVWSPNPFSIGFT